MDTIIYPPERFIKCGKCGYSSCLAYGMAIFSKKTSPYNCPEHVIDAELMKLFLDRRDKEIARWKPSRSL